MRPHEIMEGVLWSERNLTRYVLSARPYIIAYVKEQAADFQAAGGKFHAPKMMGAFASFNAATMTINLSRSEMADAEFAALVEELIHYQQAQEAGVFGRPGGWLSRYSLHEWRELSPLLEAEVDERMEAMGFVE